MYTPKYRHRLLVRRSTNGILTIQVGVVIAGEAIVGISTGAQPLIHAIPSEVLPRKYRPYAQASLNVVS